MIHKITVENFFSIAEQQELSFEIPRNAPDLSCFHSSSADSDVRLPTVVVFFGANASGKSTVLRAVANMAYFACNSFDLEHTSILFQAYRQKNWLNKPTKITIHFDSGLPGATHQSLFQYELHIAHQLNSIMDNKTVVYEGLFYAPNGRMKVLFERQEQQFYFGDEFGISNTKSDPRKEMIRANASVLSTLAKSNHPIATFLVQLINGLRTNILGLNHNPHANYWLSVYQDPDCLADLNRELRRLDVGLESMAVEKIDHQWVAKFKHVGLDGFISLLEESTGTRRFIEIFHHLYYALKTGSVVLIDELDTDFHPLLLPLFLRWFDDPVQNPHNAQLFFTAHNPVLLDYLEKEQVYFVEKPSGMGTHVYGARYIQGLRREPSLMKKYLAGELGAVPFGIDMLNNRIQKRRPFFIPVEGKSEQSFIKWLQELADILGIAIHLDSQPLNGGGYEKMLSEAIRLRKIGNRRHVSCILILDADRSERDDPWSLEKLCKEAKKVGITVILQIPNHEGLLFRMGVGNYKRELKTAKEAEIKLKQIHPHYEKPMDAQWLRKQYTLHALQQVAKFDAGIAKLLNILGFKEC